MKNKTTTLGGKNTKKPNAFIEAVKNLVANKRVVALLTLLIAVGVAKAMAEEIVGRIMFDPEIKRINSDRYYAYYLDTNKDGVVDKLMTIDKLINGPELYDFLPRYLEKGWYVVYEDQRLGKGTGEFGAGVLIGIISPEGKYIELSQMFPATVVQKRLPDLWAKAVREGRVK